MKKILLKVWGWVGPISLFGLLSLFLNSTIGGPVISAVPLALMHHYGVINLNKMTGLDFLYISSITAFVIGAIVGAIIGLALKIYLLGSKTRKGD